MSRRPGFRPLRAVLLDALIAHGGWMTRAELAAVQTCSDVALDDALAELVVERQVVYRVNVGYRLAAVAEARLAARVARTSGVEVVAVVSSSTKGYRLGVAQDFGDGMATYHEDVPGDKHVAAERLRQMGVQRVERFSTLTGKGRPDSANRQMRQRVLQALHESGKPMGAFEVAEALGLYVWQVAPALHSASGAALASQGRDGCWRLTERFELEEIFG